MEGEDISISSNDNFTITSEREFISIGSSGNSEFNVSLLLPVNNEELITSATFFNVPRFSFGFAGDGPEFGFGREFRGCNWQQSDLDIIEIRRNKYKEVESMAIDFVTQCEPGSPKSRGVLRFNSDIPAPFAVNDIEIDLDLPLEETVYEGGSVSIEPSINLDVNYWLKWTPIHGPHINFSNPYRKKLEFVAPTVNNGQIERLAFKLELFTEDGRYAKHYLSVTVQNKDDTFDNFEVSRYLDRPFSVVTESRVFGVRPQNFYSGGVTQINQVNESIVGVDVHDQKVSEQLTPVFKIKSSEANHTPPIDILRKETFPEDYQVVVRHQDGSWNSYIGTSSDYLWEQNGYSIITTTLHLSNTDDRRMDLDDESHLVSEFAIVRLESTGDGGSGDGGSGDGNGNPPSSDSGGGGSMPILLLIILSSYFGFRLRSKT